MNFNSEQLVRLQKIILELRGDKGCPWDKKQTPTTLCKYIREETDELIEGISAGDIANIKEELGDVFFLLVMVTRCFEETGEFTLNDVMQTISDKLVRRHPHVFENSEAKTEEELRRQWEEIKAIEKAQLKN